MASVQAALRQTFRCDMLEGKGYFGRPLALFYEPPPNLKGISFKFLHQKGGKKGNEMPLLKPLVVLDLEDFPPLEASICLQDACDIRTSKISEVSDTNSWVVQMARWKPLMDKFQEAVLNEITSFEPHSYSVQETGNLSANKKKQGPRGTGGAGGTSTWIPAEEFVFKKYVQVYFEAANNAKVDTKKNEWEKWTKAQKKAMAKEIMALLTKVPEPSGDDDKPKSLFRPPLSTEDSSVWASLRNFKGKKPEDDNGKDRVQTTCVKLIRDEDGAITKKKTVSSIDFRNETSHGEGEERQSGGVFNGQFRIMLSHIIQSAKCISCKWQFTYMQYEEPRDRQDEPPIDFENPTVVPPEQEEAAPAAEPLEEGVEAEDE